jgi:nucleotide-binding universal stress UspA family protein
VEGLKAERMLIMTKKILVAVDNCADSAAAVRYAARMTSASQEILYTLFHVRPPIPPVLREAAEADSVVRAEVEGLIEENMEATRCTNRELKEALVAGGVHEEQVEVVTESMQLGMAKDILGRAEEGHYDAIVLSRKALTPARDFFIGTTALKVLDYSLKVPVWVTSGNTVSMKVIIAVDGSDNSFRAVDHVVRFTGNHPDLRITLFHVLPYLRHYYSLDFERKNPHLQQVLQREDNKRMKDFYKEACRRIEAVGLKKSQINVESNSHSFDICTAIFSEMRTGQYGTVVVGRRGERDAFFSGGIARRSVQMVANQALWVVP